MATLIPLTGELSEVPPPKNESDIAKLIGSPGAQAHTAPDGSTWWEGSPSLIPENDRATRFYKARCGSAPNGGDPLRGEVLYLSADETRTLAGAKPKDDYVPVRGRTYDVRDRLKAIGARWYPEEKLWKVPKNMLAEANEIVRKGP
jgi:hypothetical protein